EKRGEFLIGGTARALKRLSGLKPVERPELADAFDRLGDAAVKLVVTPNEHLRRAVGELAPTLPREVGGAPSAALTRGLRWLAVGADAPPGASFRVVIQANDEASAVALRDLVQRGLGLLGKDRELRDALPEKVLDALKPRQAGDRVEI